MHAEDFLVNQGSNREAVEAVGENLPQLDGVATLALIVKAVDSVNRRTFMVSAQQKEVLGVLDFICEQEADCLQ